MIQRVLVADDSTTIQKVIKIALSRHSMEIAAAGSYLEAISAVKQFAPQLLIVDATLAGTSGPEQFQKLRMDAKGCPCIVLIGSYDGVDEEAFRRVGIQHFLRKPFEPGQVVTLVDQLLSKNDAASPLGGAGPRVGSSHPPPPPPPPPGAPMAAAPPSPPPPPPPKGSSSKFDTLLESWTNRAPDLRVTESMWDSVRKTSNSNVSAAPDSEGAPAADRGRIFAVDPPSRVAQDPLPSIRPEVAAKNAIDYDQVLREVSQRLESDLPDLVRKMVEDYCERHFKTMAREVLTAELRRLADEKVRHLVDE